MSTVDERRLAVYEAMKAKIESIYPSNAGGGSEFIVKVIGTRVLVTKKEKAPTIKKPRSEG